MTQSLSNDKSKVRKAITTGDVMEKSSVGAWQVQALGGCEGCRPPSHEV